MYSVPRGILAVAVVLVSNFSGTEAFPQAINFIRHAADPLTLAKSDLGRAYCTDRSASEVKYVMSERKRKVEHFVTKESHHTHHDQNRPLSTT